MKHLKKYKLFESIKSIDDICREYGIENYTINPDGTVDVDGSVYLSYKKLSKLPVKFGKVTGNFFCNNNQLTSLEGCPRTVGGRYSQKGVQWAGTFWCHDNQLTTLEGCPKTVGGNFSCYDNQLTTLEGCPRTVGGNFSCYDNQLTTLEGCSKTVDRDFLCYNNKLTTLNGLTDVSIGGDFYYENNPIYKVTNNWLFSAMIAYYSVKRPDMDSIELFNDIEPIIGDKLYLSKLEYFHEEIGKPLPDLEEVKKYYKIVE